MGQYSPQLNQLLHILELQHQQNNKRKMRNTLHQDHYHVQAGVELQSPSRHTLCRGPQQKQSKLCHPAATESDLEARWSLPS